MEYHFYRKSDQKQYKLFLGKNWYSVFPDFYEIYVKFANMCQYIEVNDIHTTINKASLINFDK